MYCYCGVKQGYDPAEEMLSLFAHIGEDTHILDPHLSIFLKPEMIYVYDHSRVDGLVKFEGGQGLVLGDHVHVSSFAHLNIGGGTLWVGRGTALTSGVKVVTGSDTRAGFYMSSAAEYKDQVVVRKTTTIREGVFVGSGAVILPGVTIGEFAIVGAGAVVTKDVPPFGIAMGVPAQIVAYRTDHPEYEESTTSQHDPPNFASYAFR